MIKVKRPRSPRELSMPAAAVKAERDSVLRFYKLKAKSQKGISVRDLPAGICKSRNGKSILWEVRLL